MSKEKSNTILEQIFGDINNISEKEALQKEDTKKESFKTNCLDKLQKSNFKTAIKATRENEYDDRKEHKAFVATGIKEIPIAYQAAEYIKKEYNVLASYDKHSLFIYKESTGCYEEMKVEGKFGVFLSQIFDKSNVKSQLTDSMKKDIFQRLVDDHELQVDPNRFDDQERYLNVANGVVDIRKGVLKPHSPKYGFCHALSLNYDEKYAASKKVPKMFGDMLKRNFPDKTDRKRFLQSMAYMISNRYANKVAFYWLGPPHTGKSTYQRLLTTIVGEKQVSHLSLRDLAKPFAIATLSDKKLNFCGETGHEPIQNLDIFKALLGNDYIDGEFKFKDHFSFRGKTKCIFAGNYMLNISENIAEKAIFDRFEFIEFSNPIKRKKQIPLFEEKLIEDEGTEILSFLVRILRKWYKNDCIFTESKSSKKAKTKFKRQSKEVDVISAFIKHCCKQGAEETVSYRALYNIYLEYCRSNCFSAMTQQTFIKQIIIATNTKRHKFHPSHSLQYWGLRGIDLKSDLKKTVPLVPHVPTEKLDDL